MVNYINTVLFWYYSSLKVTFTKCFTLNFFIYYTRQFGVQCLAKAHVNMQTGGRWKSNQHSRRHPTFRIITNPSVAVTQAVKF